MLQQTIVEWFRPYIPSPAEGGKRREATGVPQARGTYGTPRLYEVTETWDGTERRIERREIDT